MISCSAKRVHVESFPQAFNQLAGEIFAPVSLHSLWYSEDKAVLNGVFGNFFCGHTSQSVSLNELGKVIVDYQFVFVASFCC